MSKGIILYQSKYGATKRYADWLAEATGLEITETKKANINDVLKYNIVILAGGSMPRGLRGCHS